MIELKVRIPRRKYILFGPLVKKEKRINMPSSWNDLSTVQVFAYVLLVYQKIDQLFKVEKKEGTEVLRVKDPDQYHTARVGLLYFLLNLKPWNFHRIHSSAIYDLIQEHKVTDFYFLENGLTKNPLPILKISSHAILPALNIKSRIWYGPADDFRNLVLLEFSIADTFYMRYKKSREISWLDKMVAVLYRPGKAAYDPKSENANNDIRQRFNQHNVEFRFHDASRLKEKIKIAIFIWYEGCRLAMIKKYPHVFSAKKEKKATNLGWPQFIVGCAGPEFGTIEQAGHADLQTVMIKAEISLIQQEEFEREMEKKKKEK